MQPNHPPMERVSRRRPCPICGRPDWCLVASDDSAAICQRVKDGAIKRVGEAGWLHRLREAPKPTSYPISRRIVIPQQHDVDFSPLADTFGRALKQQQIEGLAEGLGVGVESLKRLGVGWNGAGFAVPMRDANGQVIGIHLRYPTGFKACERGSHMGLFIPAGLSGDGLLLVCEGASDTAAGLDLGFDAVGRPSCNSGVRMLCEFAHGRNVAVISDIDSPGRKGARALAETLVTRCTSVCVVYPPNGIKDLRQWKNSGLTCQALLAAIAASEAVTLRTKIATRQRQRRGHNGQ